MRIYAQKRRQFYQEKSGGFAGFSAAARGTRVQPIVHSIGDRAVQQPGQAEAEGFRGHTFSRIGLYAAPGAIQAKLIVNSAGDVYEQEADRVADDVLGQSEAGQSACASNAECSHSRNGRGDSARIQTKAVSEQDPGATTAPPVVNEVLAAPGKPLDMTTRGFMEARFGHDFSSVRVHADAKAAASAREIKALAYTSGTDIVFAAGRYDTTTAAGQRLLAHELTHVIQQTGGGTAAARASRAIQRQPDPAAGTSPLPLPPIGSVDLRENASPLLASALGSTTVDQFGMGSAAIPKTGEDALRYSAKQILYFIAKHPRSTVHIAGHTDRVGTDERNLSLGQERADAVSAFLQKEGVPAEIITTESKGESEPVVPTKNDQPEPHNRRVNVFFRVVKSPIVFGPDYSLKPPTFEKVPPITLPKPSFDFDLNKPRIPYRDPAETEWWKRMEENQRKIEEFDRTHPRENKSLGEAAIDLVMKDIIKPILKELPLSDDLRKKAEDGIRKGLESGSEKACEAAIDQLSIGSTEKDALKAACKATLKQKPGGGKP